MICERMRAQSAMQVLHRALLAVRVLRLVRLVVLIDFCRRDGDVRRLAARRIEDVLDLGVLGDAAVLRLGGLRRDDQRVRERALHLLQRDLARQLVLELRGRRIAQRAGDVAGVELVADELAVGIERRDLQDPLADFIRRGVEVEARRFLQEEAAGRSATSSTCLRQAHGLDHLRRERLAVHLLVLFFWV